MFSAKPSLKKIAPFWNWVATPSVVLAQMVARPGRVLSLLTRGSLPVLQGVAGWLGIATRGFWVRKSTEQPPFAVRQPPRLELPMAPMLVWNTTGVPSATGLPNWSASRMLNTVAGSVVPLS